MRFHYSDEASGSVPRAYVPIRLFCSQERTQRTRLPGGLLPIVFRLEQSGWA